jgi:hypothetical protein
MTSIEEYKALVRVTETVDYADRSTIRRSNKAVTGMYKLVRSVANNAQDAIKELAQLLDEPSAAKWLAHQLVECAALPKTTEDKCFAIIEDLAKDNGPQGMGEQIWLKEWKPRKGRT